MTTSAMSAGTLLGGRYRLDDLLSETGEARFWRGTDTVLSRSVAINVLPTANPAAARVMAAARDSAAVHDPRLLRVLDADDTGDLTWVVNEWGSGTSLDILLERGPLDPTRAAWLALETATTIEAAHRAGVCHGRLTPEAVLVTSAGAVKIIGFAISASIEGGGAGHSDAFGHLEPTEADVIDLAGVLYAGLTGRWPGASDSEVPKAPTDHHGPLRPRQVRHGVPRALDTLCDRVLRRGAHDHVVPVGSAVEMCAALHDFLGSPLAGAPIEVEQMFHRPDVPTPAYDPDATQMSPVVPAEHETPPVAEPELPPYEESAERPLFASTPRRPRLADEHGRDVPPVLPSPSRPHAGGGVAASQGVNWLRIALLSVLALTLVAAMILAYHVGADTTSRDDPDNGANGENSAESVAAGTNVPVAKVTDFDPFGSPPEENPDRAAAAADGDPATGWPTSTYYRPQLGRLKEGVGLVLDLGTQVPVKQVELELAGSGGTDVEIKATPTGVNEPPTSLDDLEPTMAESTVERRGELTLRSPHTTRFVVVWLTDVPAVAQGRYRAEVREITVTR